MFSFSDIRRKKAENPGEELQKLKRQDLLELLLEQIRESDELSASLERSEASVAELTELSDRLKTRLNDKDALIERLKSRLDLKDQMIATMVSQGRRVPADLTQMEELLQAEQRALEAILARQSQPAAAAAPVAQPVAPQPAQSARLSSLPLVEGAHAAQAEPVTRGTVPTVSHMRTAPAHARGVRHD